MMDNSGSVVLDIDSLAQSGDKSSGSPKVTKALSRKGSSRMDRRNGDDLKTDDESKKTAVKVVCLQPEQVNQITVPNKAFAAVTSNCHTDSGDARNKRLNRLTTINPRKILLLFATMSSMGTMILIYFTLTINRRG